jgi:hypothetical protein
MENFVSRESIFEETKCFLENFKPLRQQSELLTDRCENGHLLGVRQ